MPTHRQPLAGVLSVPTCSCRKENKLGQSDAILKSCAVFRAGHCHTKWSKQVTKTVCTDKARHLNTTTASTKTPLGNKLHCILKGRRHLYKIPSPFSCCSTEQQKICPPAQLYHSADALTKGERAMTEITR